MKDGIGKKTNVVVAVCHPDDETIWLGGLIHGMSQWPEISLNVVCVSGADVTSPREAEFAQALGQAPGVRGVVVGYPLRPANTPLPDIQNLFIQGLAKLGIATNTLDLLITHSPYGDERAHPHHMQAYQELHAWAGKQKVPFAYFSCVPVPYFWQRSLLHQPLLAPPLRLLQFAQVVPHYLPFRYVLDGKLRRDFSPPRFYLEFLTDYSAKARMLNAYQSIGLAAHRENYSMASNPVEALYIEDAAGLKPFQRILAARKVDSPSLFENYGLRRRFALKAKQWLHRILPH